MIDLTNFRHQEYAKYIDVWTQVDALFGGERAVKRKGEYELRLPTEADAIT